MAYVRVQPCTSVRARSSVYVAFIQGEPRRTKHSDIPAREIVLTEISRSPYERSYERFMENRTKYRPAFLLNSFSLDE